MSPSCCTNTPKPFKRFPTRTHDHNKLKDRGRPDNNSKRKTEQKETKQKERQQQKKTSLNLKCARIVQKLLEAIKVECGRKTEMLMTSIDQISV